MAIIDNKGGIHGTAGSVVYRTYRGKNVVQGRPGRRKQTAASIRSACEFGLISASSCVIRTAFLPVCSDRHDGAMGNRLTSTVSQSVRAADKERGERDLHDGDISFLNGFNFNANSELEKCLKVKPVVSVGGQGRISVSLPAIQEHKDLIHPFDRISRCRLRFLLVAINFREEFYEYIDVKDIIIERSEQIPAQELVFDKQPPKGCLMLLTLSIDFLRGSMFDHSYESLNTREFNPCQIIAAIPAAEETADKPETPNVEQSRPLGVPRMTFRNYPGGRMRAKVAKLNGKGRYPRPEGAQFPLKDPGWTDVAALTGTRASFKR